MAVLGAKVDYDYAFIYGLVFSVGIRLDAFDPLGDFQVGGNLQVVAGRNPHSRGQFACCRSGTSSGGGTLLCMVRPNIG